MRLPKLLDWHGKIAAQNFKNRCVHPEWTYFSSPVDPIIWNPTLCRYLIHRLAHHIDLFEGKLIWHRTTNQDAFLCTTCGSIHHVSVAEKWSSPTEKMIYNKERMVRNRLKIWRRGRDSNPGRA